MAHRIHFREGVVAVVAALLMLSTAAPAQNVWNGGGDGANWFDAANWSLLHAPSDTETVIISSAGAKVLLTNSTASLNSLTLTNAVLVFSNWNTCLTATEVTILNKGVVTNALCDTNAAVGNSNRVWIVCTNLMIAAGGAINVNGAGFRGGTAASAWGQGSGGGGSAGNGSGGGYGGFGGKYYSSPVTDIGQTYGSAEAPLDPGSGGGRDGGYAGGGAVRIDALGTVTVNGTVRANGSGNPAASYTGCGSGGGVYITCRMFAGTNGLVTADGGAAVTPWGYQAGGGGGGRIAVIYDPAAQSNLNLAVGKPTVQFWANPGQIAVPWGTPGTVYVTDDQVLPTVMRGGQLLNFSSWTTPSLMVSNGWTIFPTGLTLNVAGHFTAWGSLTTAIISNSPRILVGGNLVVTNAASLYVYSPPTNGIGTMIQITRSLTLGGTSTVYLVSDPTNGASPAVEAEDVTVAAGSTISANGAGFAGGTAVNGYGPGGAPVAGSSSSAGGGGYGGQGGQYPGRGVGGGTYGSNQKPIDPGSGGGGKVGLTTVYGGRGGGLVRIKVTRNLTVDGTIAANGGSGTHQDCGAGSGGGVYLWCKKLFGAGAVRANGGTGGTTSGAGGGGRIAIWRIQHGFTGTALAARGTNAATDTAAQDGTVFWGQLTGGTSFVLR